MDPLLHPKTSVPHDDWYAIYTRHQHEKTVAKTLHSAGMDVFLPTYNALRQWKDRKKNVAMPLFPCYVFLRTQSERHLRVLSTPGVHFIVMANGRPALISNHEIQAIRSAIECCRDVMPHPFLRCGDRVRVRSGPLAGVEGILIRRKSSYRLVLSAELLEKSISVEVDALSIEAIPPRAAPFLGSEKSERSLPAESSYRPRSLPISSDNSKYLTF